MNETAADEGKARERAIVNAFASLANPARDRDEPFDSFYTLLQHSVSLTTASEGAVLVSFEGRLHLATSSGASAETHALREVQLEQGPAFDAFTTGDVVIATRQGDAMDRWPDLIRGTPSASWTTVLACPLRHGPEFVGTLEMFWEGAGSDLLSEHDAALLQNLGDITAIAVLQEREKSDLAAANLQLQGALESRVKVEQAKGMVAQHLGVGLDRAFEMIRAHARSSRTRVDTVAMQVIARELDIAMVKNSMALRSNRPQG